VSAFRFRRPRNRPRWPGLEQIPWLYDACCACAERFWLAEWRHWLVGGARGRTLDLGCGTGRNLPLYGPGECVIGLDPARASLLRARRRAPDTPLVQGSAEALPFRTGAFDTVVAGFVFCSVPDARRGLAEVRRVLRPDGALRMIEHVRSTRPWKATLQDRVQPFWTWLSGGCHPNRDTERTVEDSAFAIEPSTRHAMSDLRRFAARRSGETRGPEGTERRTQ
jgi:ubiquinone/menaquinone biosynthesis C-methylase UbiE